MKTPIFPIFLINSDKVFLDKSSIDNDSIKDFGNGFFISNNGLIASVAHVLKSKNGINPYALLDGKLYKIVILFPIPTNNDEPDIDAAIGKLDLTNIDFFDPIKFERVREGSNLCIKGFSRKLAKEVLPEQFDKLNLNCNFYEIPAYCLDRTTKNLFTFNSHDLTMYHKGISGCPIFNNNDKIVGMFKGDTTDDKGKIIWYHATHIEFINEMLLNYNNKVK